MPIYKVFSENGDLVRTVQEPLNETNLEQYIKDNGVEKTLGYLEALDDIRAQFESFLEVHGPNDTWRYNTDRKITRGTIAVYEEKNDFLEFAKKFMTQNYKIEP